MLNDILRSTSFNNTHADASQYVKHKNGDVIFIVVYTDDLLLTGRSVQKMKYGCDQLCTRFKVRILDANSKFLEMVVEDGQNGVTIHNSGANEKILIHFAVESYNSVSVPLPYRFSNHTQSGNPLGDLESYQKLIGRLIYLSNTIRLDMSYATNYLVHFLNTPSEMHWKGAKHILRYLKETSRLGIFLQVLTKYSKPRIL